MNHFQQLERSIPELKERKALDLGCGTGSFLLLAAEAGMQIEGVEYNPVYVTKARERLSTSGYGNVSVTEGKGEALPYTDGQFTFINAAEVIEHVQDPIQVLHEMYRVLASGGIAYVSVPNRFGMRDQHYKMYFINWLPRSWADALIHAMGRGKHSIEAGHQELGEMHYMTYGRAKRLMKKTGFSVEDIREKKIRAHTNGIGTFSTLALYRFLRLFYFDSFHLLLNR